MSRRIIVAGAIANKRGSGGEAWVRMSWVRGFQRLGFDVELVEEIASSACVDDAGAPVAAEESSSTAKGRSGIHSTTSPIGCARPICW
jgi:hypothetical protein